jgi:hypothetical protein
MNATRTSAPLLDAFYELSLAQPMPDAGLLDDIIARYPEHADALTAFAVELAMDANSNDAGEDGNEPSVPDTAISPAVSRAVSRYHNRLYAAKRSESELVRHSPLDANTGNPFLALDREGFRRLADRLHVSTVFVAKLRDRQIEPDTITDGFRRLVSEELSAPLELVVAHFAARQNPESWRQLYKADEKPQAVSQQTFTDAVKSSGLSEEQQRRLLEL